MSFVISGLPLDPYRPLFGQPSEALAELGVVRRTADAPIGYPCRITLQDAAVGESVLLFNFEHQPAATPFRASHAIYVRETADATRIVRDEVPAVLTVRKLISLRAFDGEDMLVAGEVSPGAELEPAIERLFERPEVAYLHAHNAALGCYIARIDRA